MLITEKDKDRAWQVRRQETVAVPGRPEKTKEGEQNEQKSVYPDQGRKCDP